jgi:hypothetical protein
MPLVPILSQMNPIHNFRPYFSKLKAKAPRHEGVVGSEGIAPRTLDLGTRWGEWSASLSGRFTLMERTPWYPLDRRLSGPQSQSGRGCEEKNSQPPPEIEL